jgi:hypothetical protein
MYWTLRCYEDQLERPTFALEPLLDSQIPYARQSVRLPGRLARQAAGTLQNRLWSASVIQ